MNGNYEISSMVVSLKTLCAVKVAQQFVVANRIHLIENEFDEKEAMKRVRNMELPRSLILLLENIIKPIALELFKWNKLSDGYGDPVWASLGTVDLVQSAKLIVQNENVDKIVRYKLACRCCLEEYVFELLREFNKDPDFDRQLSAMADCNPLVKFWVGAFMGKFGESIDGGQLTRRAYCKGFFIARHVDNDIARKYFTSKISPEAREIIRSHEHLLRLLNNLKMSWMISSAK